MGLWRRHRPVKSQTRAWCFTAAVGYEPIDRPPPRRTLARACREGRLALGLTQRAVAAKVGVTRSYVAGIERGRANPSLEVIVRLAAALGLELDLRLRSPIIIGDRRQRDAVHARCSGYVDRRLRTAGWETEAEVAIVDGRWRGWIDLLAFDRRTGTLIVIEIKTVIDDMGALERQIGWYERSARGVARRRGGTRDGSSRGSSCCRQSRTNGPYPERGCHRPCVSGPGDLYGATAGGPDCDVPAGSRHRLVDPRRRRRSWLISAPDGWRSFRDAVPGLP